MCVCVCVYTPWEQSRFFPFWLFQVMNSALTATSALSGSRSLASALQPMLLLPFKAHSHAGNSLRAMLRSALLGNHFCIIFNNSSATSEHLNAACSFLSYGKCHRFYIYDLLQALNTLFTLYGCEQTFGPLPKRCLGQAA